MNSVASDPSLIGIDWGTSSLRAYLMNAKGEVLEQLTSREGIMKVADKKYGAVCRRTLGQWLKQKKLPIIASGMITSRNGWLETPYLSAPAGVAQFAGALVPFCEDDGFQLHFVTGVTTNHNGSPDVMRGEETQIIGAISTGISDGTFVMPGTHSKWVTVRDGRIEDFSTYMSGEVYEALCQHTILGTLMTEGEFCEARFREGVNKGLEAGANLLHTLFHVRTLPLFGRMSEDEVADFLSGILIGAEINGATTGSAIAEDPIIIVGRDDLAERYAIALSVAKLNSQRAVDDIVARGHFSIANSAGLLL